MVVSMQGGRRYRGVRSTARSSVSAIQGGGLLWGLLVLGCAPPCSSHILQTGWTIVGQVARGDSIENLTLDWNVPGGGPEAHALEHAATDKYQMGLFAIGQDSRGESVAVGVQLVLPVHVDDTLAVAMSSKDYAGQPGTAGVGLSSGTLGPSFDPVYWYPTGGTLVIREVSPLAFDLDVAFRPEKGEGPPASIAATAVSVVARDKECGM